MVNVLRHPSSRRFFGDNWRNFLAGFGVPGRDKAASQQFAFDNITPDQLEFAYRGDWICRKIVDIPAFDSTRAWRSWQAEKDQIEKIEEAERALGLQRKLQGALVKARLWGGSAMVIGIEGQRFEDELDVDSVGKGQLKILHVVTGGQAPMLSAGPLIRDITSPWFGEPSYYLRSNSITPQPPGGVQELELSSLGYEQGSQLYIHPSRVVRLVGLDYPEPERARDSWGDSALQPVIDAVRSAGMVSSSIASMIAEAKLDIIKVPGLTEMLATAESTQQLYNRFSGANVAKSVINATLVDKEEEWERVSLTFSGMDSVLQMYMFICSGAADIPATRLLGREPAGQNATGEGDLRNYYDRLSADQSVRLTPALSRLDEVLLRHVFGKRDPDIHYNWNPLWQMDDAQKSEVAFRKAQAHKIDVDNGLLNPDVLRVGRENQLIEDGTYPGLESAIDEFGSEPEEPDPLDDPMAEQQHAHGAIDLAKKREELKQMKAGKTGTTGDSGGSRFRRPFG